MIIGNLITHQDGTLTGDIKTLTLDFKLRLAPDTDGKVKDRIYVAYAGRVQVGSVWNNTGRDGNEYWQLKIDDPSLPAPIYVTIKPKDEDGEYRLTWFRK